MFFSSIKLEENLYQISFLLHNENSVSSIVFLCPRLFTCIKPGSIAQSVGHLTHKSEVLGSIPGLATYFCFSFC